MTKSDLKQIAKKTLVEALATAYYRLEDHSLFDSLTKEEQEYLNEQIDKYGKAMCRAIGEKYFTL